eukprot:COSAG01_NODE_382_length_17840_cov_68.658663_8_plen_64_part_00
MLPCAAFPLGAGALRETEVAQLRVSQQMATEDTQAWRAQKAEIEVADTQHRRWMDTSSPAGTR